jgi:ABC-type proline/glycine betaine transport system substrate-binding protein
MNTIGRGLRLLAAAIALAFFGTACGGQAVQGTAPPGGGAAGTRRGRPGRAPVRGPDRVNPWTGSAVNANIMKITIERELKQPVALVTIDEYAQFPALAAADLDASLEVWPSGHQADIIRYIEGRRGGPLRDGGVVDGGKLGVVGNIG